MKNTVKAPLGITVRGVDTNARTVNFVASDETVDRYGTVIDVKGWNLTNYRKNPIFLFGHDYRSPWSVMGRALSVVKNTEARQLEMNILFTPQDMNPVADMVFKMYANKPPFLNSVSVGFLPFKWEEIKEEDQEKLAQSGGKRKAWLRYVQQELLELSAVTVPANANAKKKDIIEQLLGNRSFDPVAIMSAQTALEDEDELLSMNENVVKWVEQNGVTVPCDQDCCSKIMCIEDFVKENGVKCFSIPSQSKNHNELDPVQNSPKHCSGVPSSTEDDDKDVDNAIRLVRTLSDLEVMKKAGAVLNRKNRRLLEQAETCLQSVLGAAEPLKDDVTDTDDPTTIRLKQLEEKQDMILDMVEKCFEVLRSMRQVQTDDEEDPETPVVSNVPVVEETAELDKVLDSVKNVEQDVEVNVEAMARLSAALAGRTAKAQ